MSHDSSDFDDLKLPNNYDSLLHTKRILTNVPLRKPFKHEWIRTHPTWEQPAPVLKLSGDRRDELWLLKNELVPGVPADLIVAMHFVPTINRQGTIAMWPLRIPATDGRADAWAQTALNIAREAREQWIQLHSDTAIGAYVYLTLDEVVEDPDWSVVPSWTEFRELAFRSKFITDFDHPVLQMVLHGK